LLLPSWAVKPPLLPRCCRELLLPLLLLLLQGHTPSHKQTNRDAGANTKSAQWLLDNCYSNVNDRCHTCLCSCQVAAHLQQQQQQQS